MGDVAENPSGLHLVIAVAGAPMGGQAGSGADAVAKVRGAVGDLLVWSDATGIEAETLIGADGTVTADIPQAKESMRAEFVARSSQARCLAEVHDALVAEAEDFDALAPAELARIRCALGNPV